MIKKKLSNIFTVFSRRFYTLKRNTLYSENLPGKILHSTELHVMDTMMDVIEISIFDIVNITIYMLKK